MSEQVLDIRATVGILRRHKITLAIAALVGASAGVGLGLVQQPIYTSTSLVLLPQAEGTATNSAPRDSATQIRIASSQVVLGPAGKAVHPALSDTLVAKRVKVSAPSSDVIKFVASAPTGAQAEELADAVAESEVTYFETAANTLANAQRNVLQTRRDSVRASLHDVNTQIQATRKRITAEGAATAAGMADSRTLAALTVQHAKLTSDLTDIENQITAVENARGGTAAAAVIQGASPAKRPNPLQSYVIRGLLGLLAAVLLSSVALVTLGRRDRRVRLRDELADAIGSPVLASLRSRVPRTVAGWTDLLQSYAPGTVDAWTLRQLLRHVIPAGQRPTKGEPPTITVVCLSDDDAGLAMAPQLASYAASTGIRTRLVARQRHESADALWAACHRAPALEEVRPGLLVDTTAQGTGAVELVILLAVLDRKRPELVISAPSTITVLAVSAGSATAEELARAAVTVDDVGLDITGLVVADPDDLDRTTGRLLEHQRQDQVALPSRLTGLRPVAGTESRRSPQ